MTEESGSRAFVSRIMLVDSVASRKGLSVCLSVSCCLSVCQHELLCCASRMSTVLHPQHISTYCLKRLPLFWEPLPLHGDTKHLRSKLLPSLVLLFLFLCFFFDYFLPDVACALFFVCTSPCPTRPHHLVAPLMFPVVESESWTTVGLLSPAVGGVQLGPPLISVICPCCSPRAALPG